MNKQRAIALGSLTIVAVIIGIVLSRAVQVSMNPPLQLATGTALPEPRALPELQLVDGNDASFTLANLQGHWSLLFFGYTTCPDICPTTLSTLAQVEKKLSDMPDPKRPQMVFVSVDPQRDTPANVQRYVKFFSPHFTGVTGESKKVQALTAAVGVPVIITPTESGSYTVDHSATLFAVDPKGRIAAVFSPPFMVDALSADLRRLVQ
jgi:protein SCO1/2